ncbi:MAG: outer membrane protein assembly factor BamA [Candidatus Zixiibacteriota bacterium]
MRHYIKSLLLLVACILIAQEPAAYSLQEEGFIKSIVINGNETTSRELILSSTGFSVGDKITVASLQQGVKNLYKVGLFEEVVVDLQSRDDGLILIIDLEELPRVGEILFEGNDKFKTSDLLEEINISIGQPIRELDVFQAKRKMKEKYIEAGYNLAEIKHEYLQAKNDSIGSDKLVSIKFMIDEGKKSYIEEIIFHGNDAFKDSKLARQFDETHEKKFIIRKGRFDRNAFEEDIDLVIEFYKNNGYPLAQIVSDTFYHDNENPEKILIEVEIDEGGKYYFGDSYTAGNVIFRQKKILDNLTYVKGDEYSTEKLDESLFMVMEPYQEDGYIFSRAVPKKSFRNDSIDITYEIFEGQKAYVRKVLIEGNEKTFDRVIRRELAIRPGDIMKRSRLMRSQRNVYYLNYFEEVVPDVVILEDGQVDLVFEVIEKNSGKFQVGASFNSQDKLMGTIDIGWPNTFGRGWDTNFQWEFGKERTNIVLGFTDPWFLDTPTSVGIDLYSKLWRWTSYYTEQKVGGSVRLGRRLKFPDDYFSIYGRYSLQQIDYFDFSSSYNPSMAYDLRVQDFPRLESSMRMSIIRDSRDSRLFASKGSKNSYAIEGAGHFLGGDIEYQSQEVKSDWYIPIFKYLTVVIKGRFQFVTNWGGSEKDIPYAERLIPGGVSYDGQIRGYADRSISPIDTVYYYDSTVTPDPSGNLPLVDESSFLEGGRALSIYTAELRVPVKKDQLYFSIFADAGNTWLSTEKMRIDDLYKSAGLGVRFSLPMIGVMGLDFGYGFDRPNGGDWEWHFQIGPDI